MAVSHPNATYFDFHCQGSGGKWWACPENSGSTFIGCCVDDPCANGCVQGDLQAVGYNTSHYGEWPDASCGQASNFYSCVAGDSFWGCCKSNPCATPSATCPKNDLSPAFMDQTYQFNTYVRNGSSAPSPSASTSSSTTPASSKKSNTGAIVGGAVGGVLGLALVGVLIFFLMRRKKRNQTAAGGELSTAPISPTNDEMTHETPYTPFSGHSPPPTYSAPPDHMYQSIVPPSKNTYTHYESHNEGLQELPADTSSNCISELPAAESDSIGHHRISELPAGASDIQRIHISPRPLQTGFTDGTAKHPGENPGLGVSMDGASRRY